MAFATSAHVHVRFAAVVGLFAYTAMSCSSDDPSPGSGAAGGKNEGGESSLPTGGTAAGGTKSDGGQRSPGGDGPGAAGEPGDGCPTGTAECDGDPATVCEADVTLLTRCGGCDTTCTPENATPQGVECKEAQCVVTEGSCNAGFADCDSSGVNGCEAALNTAEHCGSCGRSCGAGPCTEGLCGPEVVLENVQGLPATNLRSGYFGANHIFFIGNNGLHIVERNPATLPVTTKLIAFSARADVGGAPQNTSLTGDGTYVYWTLGNKLWKYKIDGSDPMPDAVDQDIGLSINVESVSPLTLHGDLFYIAGKTNSNGAIKTLAKTGGSVMDIFSGLPAGIDRIVVDPAGTKVAWVSYSSGLYLASTQGVSGGAPRALGKLGGYATPRLDATHLYWADETSIKRVGFAAGATVQTLATSGLGYSLAEPMGVALDDQYVYFGAPGTGVGLKTAYRLLKDGSQPPTALSKFYVTSIIHVDDKYVWGTNSEGSIVRFAK